MKYLFDVIFLASVLFISMVVHEEVHVLQFQYLGCEDVHTEYFDFSKNATYFGFNLTGWAYTTGHCLKALSAWEMETPAYAAQIVFVGLCLWAGIWFVKRRAK